MNCPLCHYEWNDRPTAIKLATDRCYELGIGGWFTQPLTATTPAGRENQRTSMPGFIAATKYWLH